MPAAGTDLLMVERAGVLHKATASEIAELGGGLPDGGGTGQFLAKASPANGDVIWADAPAGGGGGVSPPSSAINSNGVKRIGNRNGYGSVGGQALSPGWVYLQPFAPQSIEQVSGAGIEITTSGAGSLIVGLYNVTAGDTATLVAASGLIDVSATGFRTANFAAPLTPTRSEYLLALATSIQCTTRSQAAINGLMPLSAGSNNGQLFVPRTWDGTLPSTIAIGSPSGFRSHTNVAFLTT